MKSTTRKLSELENQVLQPVKMGTTKIYIEDPAECKLLETVQQFAVIDPKDWTPKQLQLFWKASEILWVRGIDAFAEMFLAHLLIATNGDETVKPLFYMRFAYFIDEMIRHAKQVAKENELAEKHGDNWEAYEKEWREHEATLEYKTPLWTRESFSHFFNTVISKPRGKKKNVEQ